MSSKATRARPRTTRPSRPATVLDRAKTELKGLGAAAASVASRTTTARIGEAAKLALRSARRHTSASAARAGASFRTAVSDHPALGVGIALAAGVLLGAMLRRRAH